MGHYEYTKASLAATPKNRNTPKDDYTELFNETLKDGFYNAHNWYTVEEETEIGSAIYKNVDIRIAHVINAETGLKLGDDWKTLLFKPDHEVKLGLRYKFDNNTWLVNNTETIKNLTQTCTIRRCNDVLRWIDENTGAYYEEPLCREPLVKEPRDYATTGSPFKTPGGFMHMETQLNSKTTLIRENQRFMFGNVNHWTCYKVVGTGVDNSKNQQTYNKESAPILVLDMVADYVNEELDDLINGIADVHTNVYTIELSNVSIEGTPSDTMQLSASVTYNGKSAVRNIVWGTSDSRFATVSNTGLVTFKAVGNCNIIASIEDNPISATCLAITTNTPIANIEVLISPDFNYILEGTERLYSAYLYENGVQQNDTFTITCSPNNVPLTNYVFEQVDGNNFRVKNVLRSPSSYLTVELVSGVTTKTFNISLKGGW